MEALQRTLFKLSRSSSYSSSTSCSSGVKESEVSLEAMVILARLSTLGKLCWSAWSAVDGALSRVSLSGAEQVEGARADAMRGWLAAYTV